MRRRNFIDLKKKAIPFDSFWVYSFGKLEVCEFGLHREGVSLQPFQQRQIETSAYMEVESILNSVQNPEGTREEGKDLFEGSRVGHWQERENRKK